MGNAVYKLLGFLFVGLATLGIFLPVLPTTPFLLVAAACFAKSSPKWHNWLMNNPRFGSLILDWQDKRCITKRNKVMAISSSLLFGGYSVFFLIPLLSVQIFTGALILYGVVFVARIKQCPVQETNTSKIAMRKHIAER